MSIPMTQEQFTSYILQGLINTFPQFANCITQKPEDVIDIDYNSNKGNLTLWITTQDKEITIGFEDNMNTDWHTHMSCFGANMPQEQLEAAIDFIRNILNDTETILFSEELGHHLDDSTEDTVRTYKWSEL